MLEIRGLTKRLGDFHLREASFTVEEGAYFVLLGASGVGKTVLLEAVAGLLRPDSGSVHLDGRDITVERIQRRGLALIYQDQALFPHLNVARNIAYGLRCRGQSRATAHGRVAVLAAEVGVVHLLERSAPSLSGGEAQRVALARALATEPRCLLLDEPLSALDIAARGDLQAFLRRLNRAGHTMLHVTHDYEEALALATHVAVMEEGRIVQVGPPEEVFARPRSAFVARFAGIRNVLPGRLRRGGGDQDDLAEFATAGPVVHVLTEAEEGAGFLLLRSEDITLSTTPPDTSARNTFAGTVTDVAPARRGVEITVDVGVPLHAVVTAGSVSRLGLACGAKVHASFKATAARVIASGA